MTERSDNVDRHGYRPNVGIVIHNARGQVFWARRVGGFDAWQFPQGGVHAGESLEDALYRELREETGLPPDAVEIRGRTKGWLRYRLPKHLRRAEGDRFRGQKQRWFLLRLLAEDNAFCLSASAEPEFDHWRWVSFWYPLGQIVAFKREVYRQALAELAPAMQVREPKKRRGGRKRRRSASPRGRRAAPRRC